MVCYPMQRTGVTAGFGEYSPFGTRTMHYAVDISRTQPKSFAVNAAHAGTVIGSFYDSGGGNMVVLQGYYDERHDIVTRYAHLKSRCVAKGDTLSCGQRIGVQGNTGAATTAQHLHFETWLVPKDYVYSFSDRAKYAVDPLSVCHVTGDQTFYKDALTYGYDGIPTPEPKPEVLERITGRVTVKVNTPFGLYPSRRYSPYIAGKNRSKSGILDFCTEKEYDALYRCENEGESWALILTGYGAAWIALSDENATLCVAETEQAPKVAGDNSGERTISKIKEIIEEYERGK